MVVDAQFVRVQEAERLSALREPWISQWGEGTLDQFGMWLVHHGMNRPAADHLVEAVWVFSSYPLWSAYESTVPLGIVANTLIGGFFVTLVVPPLADDSPVLAGLANEWQMLLARGSRFEGWSVVGEVVAGRVELPAARAPWTIDEPRFVALYEGSLVDELRATLEIEDFDIWKESLLPFLGGDRPIRLLSDDHLSRPLRDLILAVRHGLNE